MNDPEDSGTGPLADRIGLAECEQLERIKTSVYPDAESGSVAVAGKIAGLIRERSARSKTTVLGLATGSSPIQVYEVLCRLHREEDLSFANVVTFNLDEYYPMDPDELQSYVRFMREHLFDHIDIPEEAGPFHAIIVTAAAQSIPPPLIRQLRENGRLIIPVGPPLGTQYLILVTKEDGKAKTRRLIPVRFVPFTRRNAP